MENLKDNNTDFLYKHLFFYYLYFFKYDLFLLDYDEIHKKQKFSAPDIVESCGKEMWSISYVTCVEIIA